MKSITRHIPNSLTIGNLISGIVGIILAMQDDIVAGTCLIWIGAVFDFADGFAARILSAYSDTGKELDSLADMITFGTLPALIMYSLLKQQLPNQYGIFAFTALLIPVFSAIRLAKFNIDPEQKDNFRGLPTPANAFMLSGIPFYSGSHYLQDGKSSIVILIIMVTGCILMVSKVRFSSLKFRTLRLADNGEKYLIILLTLVILAVFRLKGITPAMIIYVLISLISNLRTSHKPGSVK